MSSDSNNTNANNNRNRSAAAGNNNDANNSRSASQSNSSSSNNNGRNTKRNNNRKKNNHNHQNKGMCFDKKANLQDSITNKRSVSTEDVYKPIQDEYEGLSNEDCTICANTIKYVARYSCNHITCHKCALRLRALMGDFNCPQCRTKRDVVIITDDFETSFDDLSQPSKVVASDTKFGLKFNDKAVQSDAMSILRFNCPYRDCTFHSANGWKDLKAHVKSAHNMLFCYLCINSKKAVFTKEFALYTGAGLRRHESQTEPDEDGFKGHPHCEYCMDRFYSRDELIEHLNKNHFRCELCMKTNPLAPRYFVNIEALTNHYSAEHFPCNIPSCLEKKHIVFDTKIELQNHLNIEHPDLFPSRKLDIDFTFGNSNSNNRYRSQLSTVNSSSLQPRGNNSRNNNNNNNNSNNNSVQLSRGDAFPALGGASNSRSNSGTSTPVNPTNWTVTPEMAEEADRRLQERVRIHLQNDPIKFAQFDQINEQYMKNEKTAYELISEYKRLFADADISQLEATIHGFTKVIIRNPVKVRELNRAWEEYRLVTQLPSLGVSNTSASSAFGNTAPMGRSSKSGVTPWSTGPASRKMAKAAAALSQGSTSSFPSLPPVNKRQIVTLTSPRSSNSSSSTSISSLNSFAAGSSSTARKVIPGAKPYSAVSGPMITGTNAPKKTTTPIGGNSLGAASWASNDTSSVASLNSSTSFPALGGGSANSSANSSTTSLNTHSNNRRANNRKLDLDTNNFPSLSGASSARARVPLEATPKPVTREANTNTPEDLLQANKVLRAGRSDSSGAPSSSSSAEDRKGKKKKEKKVILSYGL